MSRIHRCTITTRSDLRWETPLAVGVERAPRLTAVAPFRAGGTADSRRPPLRVARHGANVARVPAIVPGFSPTVTFQRRLAGVVLGALLALAGVCATAHASVSQIAAGFDNACAVSATHHVDCWGENSSGQLGDGTNTGPEVCVEPVGEKIYCSDSPVEVAEISDATEVAAGSSGQIGGVSCARLSSGHLDCWGGNELGALGDGTKDSSYTPVEVQDVTSAIQVAAGGDHSCALLASGHIDCWGDNNVGQLGDDSEAESDVPVEVHGVTNATAVTVGYDHTCALLANGRIDCWGGNFDGQLGDGTDLGPERCKGGFCSEVPVEASGITSATDISAGEVDTCATLSSGEVDCWGFDTGVFGTQETPEKQDTPLEIDGVADAAKVTVINEDVCALLTSGHVDCWGNNYAGQVGDGTRSTFISEYSPPVEVDGITNAIQIAGGGVYSCALLSGGQVECWGFGSYGELGDGTLVEAQETPVEVTGLFQEPSRPAVATEEASSVEENSAVLAGTVDPDGSEVSSCRFEFGTTAVYGSNAPCEGSPGAGFKPVAVDAEITGLAPNTTYHYRLVATNSLGTANSPDEMFTTTPEAAPSDTTGTGQTPHASIASTGANGTNAVPPPVLAVAGDIGPVSGTVEVKLPGSTRFVVLSSLHQVPFGSVINATHGRVAVTTAAPHGGTQTGEFFEGEFVLKQSRSGLVTAELTGGDFAACPKAKASRPASASAARDQSKRVVRKLWADAHGSFATNGRFAVATVEGTEWLTEDLCDETLIRVTRDKVAVTNLVNHRHTVVTAGHQYTAKAR